MRTRTTATGPVSPETPALLHTWHFERVGDRLVVRTQVTLTSTRAAGPVRGPR